MIVAKLEAAKSQLGEAIRLFFEKRDPVSIHTLTGAALEILHDHIDDVGLVWDNNLVFHYDTIYIKDEYRDEYTRKIREARNFFKHADRDLRIGKKTIEFNPDVTVFQILEAIRCSAIVEKDAYRPDPTFNTFLVWYALKFPNHLSASGIAAFNDFKDFDPEDYSLFGNAISMFALDK